MKKFFLAVAIAVTAMMSTAQTLNKNPNLSNGWHDWDNFGCSPIIGGIYPYPGAPYWFETTYGGFNSTNLVAQAGGGACLTQILPIFKDVDYKITFKGTRRCESDNPDLPDTLSVIVRAFGTTSYQMYSENIYNYTNTTFVWHNETTTFNIPSYANDNAVFFQLQGYNITTEFGPVLDDIFFTPLNAFTVNGPAAAAPNSGTNWSVANLPATGVTYTWSFPGATPSTSSSATPTNIQWPTTGVKTVSVVLNNGVADVVTITKNINITNTLPVSLLSFNAAAKNNSSVEVKWQTAEEINNDYFEVYRSKNAIAWELVGKANSIGINGGNYMLTDLHPVSGLNYYKLKQVDKGGAFKYSNVVKVNLNGDNSTDMYVYPTVATSSLTYVVQQPKAGKMTVLLTDVSGKRLSNTVEYFSNGTTQRSLDVSKLAAGVYLLTIMDESNGYKKSVTFNKN